MHERTAVPTLLDFLNYVILNVVRNPLFRVSPSVQPRAIKICKALRRD